jgi:hypothetical protein
MSRGPVVVLLVAGWLAQGAISARAQTGPATRPPAPASRPAAKPRLVTGAYLDLNAGLESPSGDFGATVTSTLNVEPLTFDSTYHAAAGAFVGARAGVRLGSRFSVGLGIATFSKGVSVSTAAQLPHPFFFDRRRPVSGSASGLDRQNAGIHLEVGWRIPLGRQSEVTVFAGPSLLKLSENLVTSIRYSESYPFDSVVFTGVTANSASRSAAGFNLGADITRMVSRAVGVGAVLRYSRANIRLEAVEDSTTKATATVVAGGLQAGASIRFRF